MKEAAFNIDLDRRAFKITVDHRMKVPFGLPPDGAELGVEEIFDRMRRYMPKDQEH